jgi:thioredoxin-related protein
MSYPSAMRQILRLLALIFLATAAASSAQQASTADQILASAKSEALARHKAIFLVFGASWCPPCRQMETFMRDPNIRPILEKYFVLVHLSVEEERGKHPELNSPGGEKLLGEYGGKLMGVPFLVFLDAEGQLIVNSARPVKGKQTGENIGYPAVPVEIDWFMTMLNKTIPSFPRADASAIESWLRNASSN